MEAYFLSDLHLTQMEERNSQKLLRFLTSLLSIANPETKLFFLGDIFDLWLSDHSVFQTRWAPLIEVLRELKNKSTQMFYFEGNHDLHLRPFWEKELGFSVYEGPALFHVGTKVIRCEHGDEINQKDLAYLRLRRFVRHPVMGFLAHQLPGGFWDRLGRSLSKESRKHSASTRQDQSEDLRVLIRQHAQLMCENQKFDYLISGHMHVFDDWTFEKEGRIIRSVNLGSWFDQARVFYLNENGAEWRTL